MNEKNKNENEKPLAGKKNNAATDGVLGEWKKIWG